MKRRSAVSRHWSRTAVVVAVLLTTSLATVPAARAHDLPTANANASPAARNLLNWLGHLQNRVPPHGKVATGAFGGYSDKPNFLAPATELRNATGEEPTVYACDFGVLGQVVFAPTDLPNLINLNCVDPLLSWASGGGVATVDVTLANPAFVVDTPGQTYSQPVARNGGGNRGRQGRPQAQADFRSLTDLFSSNGQRFKLQLDRIAEGLERFRAANVPVLFRPFQEMNDVGFWWSDQELVDFVNVWQVMFDYFTKPVNDGGKGLDNLLWVFSPRVDITFRFTPEAYYFSTSSTGRSMASMVDIIAPDFAVSGVVRDPVGYTSQLTEAGKVFALGQVAQPTLGYDYGALINGLRQRGPRAAYFVTLNDVSLPSRDPSMGRKLYHDMWALNRAEAGGFVPTEAGTLAGFSAPRNIGGQRSSEYVGQAVATSMGPTRVDLFTIRNVTAEGRNYIEQRTYENGTQTRTVDLPLPGSFTFIDSIAAVSWGAGRVDLFAVGRLTPLAAPSLFGRACAPDCATGAWQDLSLGLSLTSPTVSSQGQGTLDLFAVDSSGNLRHRTFADNAWSGSWANLGTRPGSGPAYNPTAISWGPGRIDLFQFALNGALSHKWFDQGAWSTWQTVGAVPTLANNLWSSPSLSSWGPGHIDVYARGDDFKLRHASWETDPVNPAHNSGWTNWQTVNGPNLFEGNNPPAGAVSRALRKIDLYYVGQSRGAGAAPGIHHRTWGCGDAICDPGDPVPPVREAVAANSASFQQCTRDNKAACANGSLITFYVSPPPLAITDPISPNFADSARGMTITLNECGGRRLRLLFVGIVGKNGNNQDIVQINAYQQGDRDEGYGTCAGGTPFQDVTWRINGSTESGFGTLDVPGRLWRTSGAIFTAFNPVAGKTGAAGFLFIPGAWSRSGADIYRPLAECLTDSSQCPVSTGGHPNFLVLYANGMEDSGCPTPNSCDANWRIRLSGTPVDGLPTLFVGRAGTGYDQFNVSLGASGQTCPPPLLQPNVEYSLDQISRHVGFTYPFDAQSNVKIRLGSPEPGRSGGLPC